MKMNLTKTATAVVFGVLCSTAALAQHSGYGGYGGQGGPGGQSSGGFGGGIERRDAINNERIEQGIRSGQITRREAARLREQQARIERMEWRARRDGFVNERERARIETAQRDLSRSIRFEKNDRQARY